MKGKWSYIILIIVFLIGLSLLLYPTVSDWWNSFHQTRAIYDYNQMVANLDNEEYDRILNSAKAYNDNIAANGIKWTLTDEERAVYESELDIANNGNMGYITIPSIDIQLPVYHGTSETVLHSSIGHLEGTSLPVGGYTSHCVLSGHRGLPSAKLFSDLDKMVVGDIFTPQHFGRDSDL
jgi:sortase A